MSDRKRLYLLLKEDRLSGSSLVSAVLPLLLLQNHAASKRRQLASPLLATPTATAAVSRVTEDPHNSILRTVIDVVQYHTFCRRVEIELSKLRLALDLIGMECTVRFHKLGAFEGGVEMTERLVIEPSSLFKAATVLTSEAHLRIDSWYVDSDQLLAQLIRDSVEHCDLLLLPHQRLLHIYPRRR